MQKIMQIGTLFVLLTIVLIGCGSSSNSNPSHNPGTGHPGFVTVTTELRGAEEVPPVATIGKGMATMTVDLSTGNISGAVSFADLTSNSTVAHIHEGAAGEIGPP